MRFVIREIQPRLKRLTTSFDTSLNTANALFFEFAEKLVNAFDRVEKFAH